MTEQLYNLKNARDPEQLQVMREYADAGWCLLCHAPADDRSGHTAGFVTPDGLWTVRPNRWPQAGIRLHLLIAPLKHVLRAEHCPDGLPAAIGAAVDEYELGKFTLVTRSGTTTATGATLAHIHTHLLVGPVTVKARPVAQEGHSRD